MSLEQDLKSTPDHSNGPIVIVSAIFTSSENDQSKRLELDK